MKKCFVVAFAAVLSVTVMSSFAMGIEYKKAKLRMSCNGTDFGNDTRAARLFIQKVKEKSNGAITITLFNNDQLASGNQRKAIELICDGTVDLDCHATSIMVGLDNRFMTGSMPWLFKDYQAVEDAFYGKAGEFASEIFKTKGLVFLATCHNGFKFMTNSKHPIKRPEDLKGLKFRIPGGEFYAEFYSTCGASPQSMSWSEVFTALQQGTVDGHDNAFGSILSANIPEVQKYISISRHVYEPFYWVANAKKFYSLPEETQNLIRECAVEACKETNKILEAEEEDAIKKFTEVYGCEVYYFTPEDIAAFKTTLQPLVDKWKAIFGPEACAAYGVE